MRFSDAKGPEGPKSKSALVLGWLWCFVSVVDVWAPQKVALCSRMKQHRFYFKGSLLKRPETGSYCTFQIFLTRKRTILKTINSILKLTLKLVRGRLQRWPWELYMFLQIYWIEEDQDKSWLLTLCFRIWIGIHIQSYIHVAGLQLLKCTYCNVSITESPLAWLVLI